MKQRKTRSGTITASGVAIILFAAALCGCRAFADYIYDFFIENHSQQTVSFRVPGTAIVIGTVKPCTVGFRSFMAGGAGYPVTLLVEAVDEDGQVLHNYTVTFGESAEERKPYVVIVYPPDGDRVECTQPITGTFDVVVENTGSTGTLRLRVAGYPTPLLGPGETYRIDGIGWALYEAVENPPISVENEMGDLLVRRQHYGMVVKLRDVTMGETPVIDVKIRERSAEPQ